MSPDETIDALRKENSRLQQSIEYLQQRIEHQAQRIDDVAFRDAEERMGLLKSEREKPRLLERFRLWIDNPQTKACLTWTWTVSLTPLFSAVCKALFWLSELLSAVWKAPTCDKVTLFFEFVLAVGSSVMTGLRAGSKISWPPLPWLAVIICVACVAFVIKIYQVMKKFRADQLPKPHDGG